MRVVMEHETAQGRQVYDVSEKNLGYDVTSLDLDSGDLRLIEVKGIGAVDGHGVADAERTTCAEDRRDCYLALRCHRLRFHRPAPGTDARPGPP